MHLCLRYGLVTLGIELKVWRNKKGDPQSEGLEQLDSYLAEHDRTGKMRESKTMLAMTTKITLDIDEALIQKAELWAQQQQLSLSDVISNFLRQLPEPDLIPQEEHPLAKFAGILSDSETRELQHALAAEFEQIDTNEW